MLKQFIRILSLVLMVLLLSQPLTVFAAEEPDTMADFRELIGTETILAALYEADIPSLRKAIDMGLISCQELTAYYLERIETYNKNYNCFITMCDDALAQAKECDAKLAAGTAEGDLFGIPIVVKDNYFYKGYLTTNGKARADSQVATATAKTVQYLIDEGAIVLAKTNMSTEAENTFETYSEAAGFTRGAYSSLVSPGGSSGGSAVATSVNFAVAGLGTDTNASLRYPAALSGCVSLRVTFGKLSMNGIYYLNRTRDVPGVITRTVYDQAQMLDTMSGGSTHYTENLDSGVLSGMRLGVLKELSYPTTAHYLRTEKNIDDEVAAAFENAIDELESLGAEIVTVSVPDIFTLSKTTIDDNTAESKLVLYQTIKAAMERAGVSALIFPTYLNTPLRSGKDNNGRYWDPYSLPFLLNGTQVSPSSGMPEITVPIGLHSLGAGIGMEIAALKNEEQLLLNIAYSYTSQYDHRVAPSGAKNLYSGELSLDEIFAAYETYLDCLKDLPNIPEYDLTLEQIISARQLYFWCQDNLAATLDFDISLTDYVDALKVATVPKDPNAPYKQLYGFLQQWAIPILIVLLLMTGVTVVLLVNGKRKKKKKARRRVNL